jgi:hypothetical protein
MTPWVLAIYFARRFLLVAVAFFVVILLLIYTADLIELLRRGAESTNATAGRLAFLALLRAPFVAEETLPFVALFAAMACLTILSRDPRHRAFQPALDDPEAPRGRSRKRLAQRCPLAAQYAVAAAGRRRRPGDHPRARPGRRRRRIDERRGLRVLAGRRVRNPHRRCVDAP